MKRAAALCLSLLISVAAHGAITYRLTTTVISSGKPQLSAVRVWVDGQRYRMELGGSSEPRTHDVVISTDADRTATMLNLAERTWFKRDEFGNGSTSRVLRLPAAGDQKLSKLKFETHDKPSDVMFEGHRTEKHVMRISYVLRTRVLGASLTGTVTITAMFISAPDLPQAPYRINFKSGFPEVDDAVLKFVSSIPSLLVDQTISITQLLERARPRPETTRTTIEDYRTDKLPAGAFEIPAGFRHQLPRIAAPGG